MNCFYIKFVLHSDTTFGRGDGVAGLVDDEVQHEESGLPYLGGRALKGIMVNECADILAALPDDARKEKWIKAAGRLFGKPGSTGEDDAILSFGDALLPDIVRSAIGKGEMERDEVLATITSIRKQTAMELSGVPKEHSLRSQRVILRETPFFARLVFSEMLEDFEVALLQACIMAFRRAGSSRNRGRGKLTAQLCDDKQKPIAESKFFAILKNDYLGEAVV